MLIPYRIAQPPNEESHGSNAISPPACLSQVTSSYGFNQPMISTSTQNVEPQPLTQSPNVASTHSGPLPFQLLFHTVLCTGETSFMGPEEDQFQTYLFQCVVLEPKVELYVYNK